MGEKKVQIDVGVAPLAESSSTRDWSELPLDALTSIFGKLGAIEILMGAGLVCRTWLAAAKLPDLWRSVDMARHKVVDEIEEARSWLNYLSEPKINSDLLCAMARVAVDRSGGQMEEFVGKLFVTDELLKYIGDRSPALKAVSLIWCNGISNEGFTQLVAKCPMLEVIQLSPSICQHLGGRDLYEYIGMACAQLRCFALRKEPTFVISKSNGEALGVAAMHELRSLTLECSDVTNDELAKILDGCPHLELLHLHVCPNIVADDALNARCAGIKSLMLPGDRVRVVREDCECDQKLSSCDCHGDYWDAH